MKHYNARIEFAGQHDPDQLVDALEGFSPAVGTSPRGWTEAIVTLPADSIQQATRVAFGLIASATDGAADVVAIEVMPTTEFDARIGFGSATDLVGATEAAEILSVTRQRIVQMIDEHKLPGTLVGKSWVIPREAVLAARG